MIKKISFSILGLGRVVDKRVFHMFKYEIKNGYVKAVFDIDKNKKKNLKNYLNVNLKNQ